MSREFIEDAASNLSGSSTTPAHNGGISDDGWEITCHFWVWLNSLQTEAQLIQRSFSTEIQWHIKVFAGKLRAHTDDGTGVSPSDLFGSTTLSTGQWYSAVMQQDSSSLRWYLNGAADGSMAPKQMDPVLDPLFFLGSTGSLPFDGRLAEIAVWPVAIPTWQIDELAAGASALTLRPDDLAGYWPLWGANDPENDLSPYAQPLGVNGPVSQAEHPPVAKPFGIA